MKKHSSKATVRNRTARRLAVLAALAMLSACGGDNDSYHHFHSKHHHGQQAPKWFKPPQVQ